MAKRRKQQRPAPARPTRARSDGYENRITGTGTRRDPSKHSEFIAEILSNERAIELYRGNDIAKKVVEYRVRAAFREGFTIKMDDAALAGQIGAALEDLGVNAAFRQAGFWENSVGGAAILPIVNDGADLAEPLRDDGRMVRIESLLVLDARELRPVSRYRSIKAGDKFGKPMRYRFEPRTVTTQAAERGQLIHESRLIIFPGVQVVRDQSSVNPGWGDSILCRPNQVIEQFGTTWDGIAILLKRIEQGVLKVKDLWNKLAQDEGSQVRDQLLDINVYRNLLDMLVVSDEDDYKREGVPLSGVADVLEKLMYRLSAACEMPAAFLVGMSPTGLNSTGDAETRSWYDSVAEEQEDHFKPRVEQLVRMYMRTNDSVTGGREPDVWSIKWNPLWQESKKEEAETNDTQARADKAYFDMGLPAHIIFRNRFGDDEQSLSTTMTEEELSKTEELPAPTSTEIAAVSQPDEPAPTEPAPTEQSALDRLDGADLALVEAFAAALIRRKSTY